MPLAVLFHPCQCLQQVHSHIYYTSVSPTLVEGRTQGQTSRKAQTASISWTSLHSSMQRERSHAERSVACLPQRVDSKLSGKRNCYSLCTNGPVSDGQFGLASARDSSLDTQSANKILSTVISFSHCPKYEELEGDQRMLGYSISGRPYCVSNPYKDVPTPHQDSSYMYACGDDI